MEKMNLSLKSIYRLLMTNDFPIYSESVIDERNRKGQTLLKFWQSLVISDFRSGSCGHVIWRNDGKRNRYISNLCNRNPEMKFYLEYAKELTSSISTVTLLNQINRFSAFLSSRNYKHDILLRRIQALMRLVKDDDPHVSNEIAIQIENSIVWQGNDSNKSLFQASYLLTVLMLYAAAGEVMDDSVMDVLREDDYTISALWTIKNNPSENAGSSLSYLTEHIGILQDNPLPHQRFFGREEELFNLKEMAAQGRKCLISGVGGIGKTELLRQLIRSCEEEASIDYIAIVPYSMSIVDSFGKVFSGFQHQEPEESFNHALYQLEEKAKDGSRVLLLIDDVNNTIEDDLSLKKLASLSCGVLITSRRLELEGFETYRICDPSVSTCALIFRDNYKQPLTPEDRAVLNELMRKESLRHPLTLRLMARAAHSNGWSVQELKEHLLQNNISLTWVEDDRIMKLDQIYHQLYSYSRVPEECQKIVELFSLLPMESYSQNFLEEVFPDLVGGGEDLASKLSALTDGGWLDDGIGGYFMHPLISQCLRRKIITEVRLDPAIRRIRLNLPRLTIQSAEWCQDASAQRMGRIFMHMIEKLSGKVSRNLILDAITAISLQCPSRQAKALYRLLLERMIKRCPEPDDVVEIRFCTLMTAWQMGESELIEQIYRKQKEQLTVSRTDFLDFCAIAGTGVENNLTMQPELVEAVLREVLCDDATSDQKAFAYSCLSALKYKQGDWEEALRWGRLGVDFVDEHPECSEQCRFVNYQKLCSGYLQFRQKEQAEGLLRKIARIIDSGSSALYKLYYEDLAGHYEMDHGSPEQALTHLREAVRLQLEYCGEDLNYCGLMAKIAIVLQRMKQYNEALEHYRIVVSYARESGHKTYFHVFSNNQAVVYLDMGKPREAIECLEAAIDSARTQGGLALAEPLRNMARAHGLLGEYTKERKCLAEAVPLLEAAYGVEHPRAVAARERLNELLIQK